MSEEKMKTEVGFLDEQSGAGFENMKSGDTSTPMLLISQPLSELVAAGNIPAGHFYNSLSGKDYGTSLKMVVIHQDKVWNIWKPNQGGFVRRVPVDSIKVIGDNFTGMKDEEGNSVVETLVYIVILPEHLEDGYLAFSSTPSNMKYMRTWNTSMRYLRLPSNKPAPIYGAVWNASVNKDQNKKGNVFYSCNDVGKSSFRFDSWITQDLYTEHIEPARTVAARAIGSAPVEALPETENSAY